MRFAQSRSGQTTTEVMLLISVIVIAIVAAAYIMIPTFQDGVQDLAEDVSFILSSGDTLITSGS
jgi:predicted PurR-regulated permease PerM